MEILIQVLQFFMSLTLLVAVHEFGHFIVARLFKIRVEKFYIFFDWGFSLWKKKWRGTEYGLGWLPLGGYCKIAGMVDESMDKEQLASEPQPWEYRSKPAWQRFLVLVAGVTMNAILAFFIFSGICFSYGTEHVSTDEVEHGFWFSDNAKQLGFQDGDHILSIDGEQITDVKKIGKKVIFADGDCEIKVLRDGSEHAFTLDNDVLNSLRNQEGAFQDMYAPLKPFIVDSVVSPTLAEKLQKGDHIIGVGDERFAYLNYWPKSLDDFKDNLNNVELSVVRGSADTLKISVPLNEEGGLDIVNKPFAKGYVKEYGFFEAFAGGAALTGEQISDYWRTLTLVVNPKTNFYKQVGGFVAIGNAFPDEWNWYGFWRMTAILSIILAVMNIIPIPGLDGGHMLFTFWEMVTRRKVSEKVLTIAQYIGMGLILLLLLFANGNDIFRLFSN